MRRLRLDTPGVLDLATSVLRAEGTLELVARGWSMVPSIQDGDLLTIVPAAPSALRPGDVVMYRNPAGQITVHRLEREERREDRPRLIMRGDATAGAPDEVAPEHVLGKVVAVRRPDSVTAPPWKRWIVEQPARGARWLLRRVQALGPYRRLARPLASALRARLGPIQLREVAPADGPALRRFFAQGGQKQVDDPLAPIRDGNGYGCVAWSGPRVVGAAVLRCFPQQRDLYPDWWIFNLLVSAGQRGTGLGARLVEHLLERAVALGAARVLVMVSTGNEAALGLYRKLGFVTTSVPGLDEQLESAARDGTRFCVLAWRPPPSGLSRARAAP